MGSGILEVSLVEAEDLKEKDLSCWLSCFRPCFRARKPYVLIQYGSQKHMSCVAKEKGEKEIWEEKFKFNVKYEGENDIPTNTKLKLHIMDKHRLSSDKLVGETRIYVKDIILDGMDEGRIDIEPQKHRVVRVSDKSYSGEISVALTFTKAIDETKEVEIKGAEANEENIENHSLPSATAIELV